MNKTDLLFQMMEHPQQYTADEWQKILADEECRELYTLISKTQSAIDTARVDEEITDEMIDAEWQRFRNEKQEVKSEKYSFLKIAAMFVGILMLSGLTYAAIHIISHNKTQKEQETVAVSNSQQPSVNSQVAKTDTIAILQPRLYDNVPLSEIFEDLSDYYHIKVVYQNEEVQRLRLFYQWKPDYSIEKVVEMLNNFEWLQLALKKDSLFVSSTIEPQP